MKFRASYPTNRGNNTAQSTTPITHKTPPEITETFTLNASAIVPASRLPSSGPLM